MSFFTSPIVPVILERQDVSQPWGFRLQGGADYRLALSVKKVTQGTPAHQKLHPGDVIVTIQGNDVTTAPHVLCNELIANSGLTCQFTVRK